MSVEIFITHAAWVPERAATLERLLRELEPASPIVLSSLEPEHSSVWARRAWDRALESDASHLVFLNDDVRVCPEIAKACEAIAEVLPDEVVSLHCTAPQARTLLHPGRHPGRWLRSYWLTGPAYMIPRTRLASLCTFADAWRDYFREHVNEDNLTILWSWEQKRPIWNAVPALAEHDVKTRSTLGHDAHAMRSPPVTWRDRPCSGVPLTSPAYWRPGHPSYVPNIECGWFPTADVKAIHEAGPDGATGVFLKRFPHHEVVMTRKDALR